MFHPCLFFQLIRTNNQDFRIFRMMGIFTNKQISQQTTINPAEMRFLNLLWWYLATILRIISWSVVEPEYYFINGNILTSFSVQLKFNTDPVSQPDTTNADFSLFPPSISLPPLPPPSLPIYSFSYLEDWERVSLKSAEN